MWLQWCSEGGCGGGIFTGTPEAEPRKCQTTSCYASGDGSRGRWAAVILALMSPGDNSPGSQHWAQTPPTPALPHWSPKRPQHAAPYFLDFDSRLLFFKHNFRIFIHGPGPLSWGWAKEQVSGLQVPLLNCGIRFSSAPLLHGHPLRLCHRSEGFASGSSSHSWVAFLMAIWARRLWITQSEGQA